LGLPKGVFKGVFGGEVTCVFLNKKYVFIVFEGVVYT
jgi:hypothetical protein